MLVTSCSSIHTKTHFEKHVIITTIIITTNPCCFLLSDVVFDTRIIPALVKVIRCVLTKPDSILFIASTVRNEATRDTFIQALSK